MTASLWLVLLPLWIVLALLVVLGVLALLSRVAGGRYVRPIVQKLMKVPLLGRGMKKASEAALERQNPELASAIKKLQRSGATTDPLKAQQAMSRARSQAIRGRGSTATLTKGAPSSPPNSRSLRPSHTTSSSSGRGRYCVRRSSRSTSRTGSEVGPRYRRSRLPRSSPTLTSASSRSCS